MEQIEWVLVPKNATQEMCAAAVIFANGASVYETVAEDALKIEESIYGEIYDAMIEAAQYDGDPAGVIFGTLGAKCRQKKR